MVSRDRL